MFSVAYNFARRVRVLLLVAFGGLVWGLGFAIPPLFDKRCPAEVTRRRSVTLIGAYGNSNFGDDIVAVSILDGLRGCELGEVKILGRRPDFELLRRDLPESDFIHCGDGFKGLLRTWRGLPDSRGIAILGGGGLLEGRRDDVNVHRLVVEYSVKLLLARLKGNTILIHGIGISPNFYSSAMTTWLVKRVLRAAAAVSVRDPASVQAANSASVSATLVRDPASALFNKFAADSSAPTEIKGIVLLDVHRWPHFSQGTAASEKDRQRSLDALAMRMCGWAEKGTKLAMFVFHESDRVIIQDLCERFYLLSGSSTAIDVFDSWSRCTEPFIELMSCGSVYSMRFHPGLAGLIASRDVEIVGPLQKLNMLRETQSVGMPWKYPDEFADPAEFLLANVSSGYVAS